MIVDVVLRSMTTLSSPSLNSRLVITRRPKLMWCIKRIRGVWHLVAVLGRTEIDRGEGEEIGPVQRPGHYYGVVSNGASSC